MLSIYKTVDGRVTQIRGYEPGCWISLTDPTEEELELMVRERGIDPDFIRAALDEEETSRVESYGGQTLIIVDVPAAEPQKNGGELYSTVPFGIIVADEQECFVTVSLRRNAVVEELSGGTVKNVRTEFRTQLLLTLLMRIAMRFLYCLRQIERASSEMEKRLDKPLRDSELMQLLSLEKSLVYFSTSLGANEATMEKLQRGRLVKLYDEDAELLDDTLIEMKQAIEMCGIYSSILSRTRDAVAALISNRLNVVMKVMTVVTILMEIPTMIFSFYGMNTDLPLPYTWFPTLTALLLTGTVAAVLFKKGMFR